MRPVPVARGCQATSQRYVRMERTRSGSIMNRDGFGELTRREKEVLAFIAQGQSTKEIAHRLARSPETIANHRKQLCRKLNVHSTAELVRVALQTEWLGNAPKAGAL
jgi:DNA-binding NarL/FixJ family response regulator